MVFIPMTPRRIKTETEEERREAHNAGAAQWCLENDDEQHEGGGQVPLIPPAASLWEESKYPFCNYLHIVCCFMFISIHLYFPHNIAYTNDIHTYIAHVSIHHIMFNI